MTSSSQEELQLLHDAIAHLIERHRVLTALAGRQVSSKRDLLEQMQQRQNMADIERRLRGVHPADLAALLESFPSPERLLIWRQLPSREAGLTLVELSGQARQAVLEEAERRELVAALEGLDADDLGYLSDELPPDVLAEVSARLGAPGRTRLAETLGYAEDSVGRIMRQDTVECRDDATIGAVAEAIRQLAQFPEQTDRVFVVDARHILKGSLPLHAVVRSAPETPVASLLEPSPAPLTAGEPAARAAKAFERYDLVSAAVVDERGKLIGRLTSDAVVDYLRESSDQQALAQAGLRGAEDQFATIAESARNRWPWLALNLLTAFAASRVIGAFEHTITQIVALATLMPIVASIGGNTGNQTVALVIRSIALDQLRDPQNQLLRRELTISLVNGLVWGAVVGVFALLIYGSPALGGVMTAAVVLNLLVAALAGVTAPLALRWAGRDPAQGSSVIVTFITDGMGFFFLLGLAQWWLA
jgi:magnesium transporter